MVDNTDGDSDSQENGTFNNTRRQFVAGSAALGGIAVGSSLALPSLAQEDDAAPPEPIQNEFEDDVDILNYALTLERLEAAFYRQGLENFEEGDFAPGTADDEAPGAETEGTGNETADGEAGTDTSDGEAGNETSDEEAGAEEAATNETASQEVVGFSAQEGNETGGAGNQTEDDGMGQGGNQTEDDGMGEATNETSDDQTGEETDQAAGAQTEAGQPYSELQTILAHEEEHVTTLETVIEDLGGEVAPEPEVDFGAAVEEPMEFLGTAAQLEDIGVSAYAGAAPFIQNEDLVAPALSIHSVEARHAGFVRTLTNQSAFPNPFDEARSRSEVLELAGQFINNIDEFEPAEETAEDEEEEQGTPEISIEEFRNQTEDDEVGNETDGTMGNETDGGMGNGTDGGVGNETDGNTTGENATDA